MSGCLNQTPFQAFIKLFHLYCLGDGFLGLEVNGAVKSQQLPVNSSSACFSGFMGLSSAKMQVIMEEVTLNVWHAMVSYSQCCVTALSLCQP